MTRPTLPFMNRSNLTPAAGDECTAVPTEAAAAPARLVFPHQQEAFEQLLEIAQVALNTQWRCFPVRPRTNTLIVGASGVGKTHMALALGETLNIPAILLSVSEWVLMGCSARGAAVTWPKLVEFLHDNRSAEGVIIALDEIDKLSRATSWETFQMTEVFSALDFRVPHTVQDADGEPFSAKMLESASEVLTGRTMILGMGAFQDIWDKQQAPAIGFRSACAPDDGPTLRTLAKCIPTELANRFRSQIITLRPLVESDYHAMLVHCAESMPANFRDRFLRMGRTVIPRAARNHQGPRFLEELLVDLLIAERKEVRAPVLPTSLPKDQLTL